MRSFPILFLGLLTVAGCRDLGGLPNNGLSATTQRPSYVIGENITFTISNAGSQTVVLASCCVDPAFYVDRLENGAWSAFEGHGIPCLALCPSRPYDLPAQTRIVDSTRIQQAGAYRLRFPYGFAPGQDITNEFPSNEFTVH